MNFVDDEDLEAVARRSKADCSDNGIANIVDPRVRGSIDLLHVNGSALGNLPARGTGVWIVYSARGGRRPDRLVAIERFGQQARRSCLANATGAGEKIRVMQTLMLDSIRKRLRDDSLAGNVGEGLRPPFTCDYLVCHKLGE